MLKWNDCLQKKKKKKVKYLSCVIDVFTKYACVKPLNDKKLKHSQHRICEYTGFH